MGSHWEVFYKKAVQQLCYITNQKNACKGVQFFIKVARVKSATLLKLKSTDAAVYFVD